MKLDIDLAQRSGMNPVALTDSPGDYFPEFTFRYDEEREFPSEGTMTIAYKVTRSSKDTKDKINPFSCTIEVHKILSAEGNKVKSPAKNSMKDTEDSLDALAKKKSEENGDDEGGY